MVAGSSSLFPQMKICFRDVFTFKASAKAHSPLFPMLLNDTTRLRMHRKQTGIHFKLDFECILCLNSVTTGNMDEFLELTFEDLCCMF